MKQPLFFEQGASYHMQAVLETEVKWGADRKEDFQKSLWWFKKKEMGAHDHEDSTKIL